MSAKSSPNAVLVTGGAGYIGSHACKALAGAGFAPVTFDNLATGARSAVRWGPLEEGDLGDTRRLRQIVEEYRPIGVLHFAGRAYVDESIAKPGPYYRTNVAGTLSLLEALRGFGGMPIVFSSSCTVYGRHLQVPLDETHPRDPISPYGRTKLIVERMLADFFAVHGSRYVALRYFNAAGADPDAEIGERHDPETHLIPRAIEAALGRRSRIEVYGSDYKTADGTAIRDYVHVTDLANAHVLALQYLIAGGECAAFNLGTGTGHSVRQVISAVERVSARRVPVRASDRRPGDAPCLVARAERAREVLGWLPRYGELAAIVETAWRWHSRREGT